MEVELPGEELYRKSDMQKTEYLLWDLTLYLRRESEGKKKSDQDPITLQVIYNQGDPDYNVSSIRPCTLPLNVKEFYGLIENAAGLWQDYVLERNTTLGNVIQGGQQYFQRLFGTPDSEEALTTFRTFLRKRKKPLRILVMAEPDLQFPWNLLYADNEAAAGLDPIQGFLGSRHTLVQELELKFRQRGLQQFGSREHVHISLQRDPGDEGMAKSLDDILNPLEQQKIVELHKRNTINELLNALQLNKCPEDFMYFCCHGGPENGEVKATPENPTCFWFKDQGALYPVQFSAAIGDNYFQWQPMVFINSCHAGMIGRTYFESFVPLLLTSGASTVVAPTVAVKKAQALNFADELMNELFHGANYNTPKQEIVADVVQRVRARLLKQAPEDATPLLFQTAMRAPVHFARRLKLPITNVASSSPPQESHATGA